MGLVFISRIVEKINMVRFFCLDQIWFSVANVHHVLKSIF